MMIDRPLAYLSWDLVPLADLEARWVIRGQGYAMPRWMRTQWDGIQALAEWQDGRCAACAAHLGPLLLDHDHRTGLVRGWLCGSCNTLEGFGDPRFETYCARPPAIVLGVEEMYPSPDAISPQPASVEELGRFQWERDPANKGVPFPGLAPCGCEFGCTHPFCTNKEAG